MGIVGFIGVVIALGSFYVMSRTSRVLLSVLLAGSLYYWYSISAVFHGGSGPDMGEVKIAMTLLSANIGGFIVATVLGIMKRNSSDEDHYAARKKTFFVFLAKWGAIYAAYAFIGGKLIDLIFREDGVGWFFMRAWGPYVFIAILILRLIFKKKETKKNRLL